MGGEAGRLSSPPSCGLAPLLVTAVQRNEELSEEEEEEEEGEPLFRQRWYKQNVMCGVKQQAFLLAFGEA